MVIPNTYAQANFRFTGAAAPTGSEVTLGLGAVTGIGTPVQVGEVLFDAWDNNISAVQSSDIELVQVSVKFGPDLTGPSGDFNGSALGNIGSAAVSPNVTLLVKKITVDGGRAGRGRLYMPGITEVDVSAGGLIDSAYLAAAQTAWDDFFTEVDASGLNQVLLHGADSPLGTPSEITSYAVDSTAATQRRRMRR